MFLTGTALLASRFFGAGFSIPEAVAAGTSTVEVAGGAQKLDVAVVTDVLRESGAADSVSGLARQIGESFEEVRASGGSEAAGGALKSRHVHHPRPWPRMPSWVTRLSGETILPRSDLPRLLCAGPHLGAAPGGLFRDVTALLPIYRGFWFRAMLFPDSELTAHLSQTGRSSLEDFAK
jgi:hypothetical protein